jgi:hypothetical protein
MWNSLSRHIARSRTLSSIGILTMSLVIALSPVVVQARVADPMGGPLASQQSQDTVAKATGGGTVFANISIDQTVSSFGVNARRPVGFVSGGLAEGRINYNRHKGGTGRHVNVPVVLMQAETSDNPGPNGTGGSATIIGDCTVAGATCPPGDFSALVYIEDNSDSGANSDIFRIFFCAVTQALPGPGFDGTEPPSGCVGPDGGLLRSGNIQVRANPGVTGESMATAAAAGAFTMTPNLNGVELAGGTSGVGVRSGSDSAYGDLHAQFNGISLIGMFQRVTVTGWITSASVNGGTMTLSGTATLDMGDGAPPVSGISLVGTLTASGLTLTIGGTALPTLPRTDGFITIE